MKNLVSYYDVLKISKQVSLEEIKIAYRKLALQFHPDRISSEAPDLKEVAEEEFKRIQEAYEVLSAPEKRKRYDEELENLKAGQAPNQGGSDACPIIRVDKNYFKFKNLKPNDVVSDVLTVFNAGGDTLIGTIIAGKSWISFSETVISTSDYQEIGMTIDVFPIRRPGFNDSALIEIETNGGKETVVVDISIELSFITLLSVYVKPAVNSFGYRVLTIILGSIFLIGLLFFNKSSEEVSKPINIQTRRSPPLTQTSMPSSETRDRSTPKEKSKGDFPPMTDPLPPVSYPIASGAKDIWLKVGKTAKIKIYPDRWSGWINLPPNAEVGMVTPKGIEEPLYWIGEPIFIKDKRRWLGAVPHCTFRIRGAESEVIITAKKLRKKQGKVYIPLVSEVWEMGKAFPIVLKEQLKSLISGVRVEIKTSDSPPRR